MRSVFKADDIKDIINFVEIFSISKAQKTYFDCRKSFSIERMVLEFEANVVGSISSSVDKITWEFLVSLDNIKNVDIILSGREVRYFKIDLAENNFQIKNAHIYVRKFPGLMVAARSDGFGARFLPILNAMYLAEYTGFKFGFVWQKSAHDTHSLKEFEGNELAGIHLGEETDIFSGEFIKKYSYTGAIKATNRSVEHRDIKKMITKPYEKEWGNYVNYNTARYVMRGINAKYLKEYPRLWKQIGFSDVMQKVINDANLSAQNRFPNGFIAIHIRSGDGVYDERVRKLGAGFLKTMPIEIAIHFIEDNLNKNEIIVLFGDDFTSLKELKRRYSINLVEDFIENEDNKGGLRRIMFEIVFMSNAKDIFCGGSSFSRTASFIGLGREPSNYSVLYSQEQLLNIMQKYNEYNNSFSNLQKAHSLYYISMFLLKTGADNEIILSHLMQAQVLDKNNCLYEFLMIYVCLVKKKYLEAERILEKSLLNYECYLENLSHYTHGNDIKRNMAMVPIQQLEGLPKLIGFFRFVQDNFCQTLLDIKDEELFNLREMLATAKDRIHNHLAYKLGSAMILNSKSFLGYIRMPYVLSFIKEAHKKEIADYEARVAKNPSLKLPKLESYADYKEALKEKECFTYKLGEALIKANSVRGGGRIFAYLAFFKEVRRLKREFREKRK